MPWGVAAAVGASAVGSAVSSAMAPSSGSGSGSQYYTPTGLGAADTSWQNLLAQQQQSQAGIYNTSPLYQQSLNAGQAAQQQYAGNYQNAAHAAGSQYGNLGTQLQGAAGQQFGAQTGLLNAGQQLDQTSLDPQNAL